MDEFVVTCLLDIYNACVEVDTFFADNPKLYEGFRKDTLRIRAVERNVEIMGEAINRILKKDESFELPNARAIVQTRNRVIHGYDSVTTEFLWSLVIKHIPALKADVYELIKLSDFSIENYTDDKQ